MIRRSAGPAARLAVAVGLTAYILWRSDPSAAVAALAGVEWRYIAAAVALVLADRALMAYRWLVLLRPLPSASHVPFHSVLRIFFVSTFVGTFLPASVGGDAVRAVALSRHAVPLADVVASVLLDRVFGTLAILLVGAVAVSVTPVPLPDWLPAATVLAAAAAAIGVMLTVFSEAVQRLAHHIVDRVPFDRLRRLGTNLLAALRQYRTSARALGNVLAGSIGVQLLRVWQAWLLGLALGITVGPMAYLVYIPIVLLVMLLPITVNGIGTSQAAFVWLFALSGVAAADAFALSVLFVALGIVGNLPGALLYVSGGVTGLIHPAGRT